MCRVFYWATCVALFLSALMAVKDAGAAETPIPQGVTISATVDNSTPRVGEPVRIRIEAENTTNAAVDLRLMNDMPSAWLAGAQVTGASRGTYDLASGKWDVKIAAATTAILEIVITALDEVPHAIVVRNWSDPPPAPGAVVRPTVITSVVVTPKYSKCCHVGTPEACGKIPCCKQRDACILYTVPVPQRIDNGYTAGGVNSFIAIFNAAATRGVENATVRAFNATKACPECKDCPEDQPCGRCGTRPEFPRGWKVSIVNGKKIARLGRRAFDTATGEQVVPDTGAPNPNYQFELRRHAGSNQPYVEWVRWLDQNGNPRIMPALMPSTSFDLETGKQINPANGTEYPTGTATHRLILTEELWSATRL